MSMKTLNLCTAIFTSTLLISCSDNVSGSWEGACINDTAGGVTAPMQLMLNISGKKVNGALMLGGSELIGSGEITGHIHGKSITFQSPGDGTTFTQITWMGTISGNVIEGSYRVEPTTAASLIGITPQNGRFTVTK